MREYIHQLLLTSWVGPVMIPLTFAFIGVLAKSVAKKRLERDSFFLGVEGCLAAMSMGLASLFRVSEQLAEGVNDPTSEDMAVLLFFLVANFGGVMFVMFLHQGCEPLPDDLQHSGYTEPSLKRRIWVQGLACNAIGLGLMVMSAIVFR